MIYKLQKSILTLLILCSAFSACKRDTSDKNNKSIAHNSSHYNKINFASGGDYLNLVIGDSKEEVKKKLKDAPIVDEDEGAIWYMWDEENYQYYLDTYFENNNLYAIDVYVYFYKEANSDEFDKEKCATLYEDWKKDYTSKNGKAEEIVDGEYIYSLWTKEDSETEVGVDGEKAYIYIYALN